MHKYSKKVITIFKKLVDMMQKQNRDMHSFVNI